MSPSIALASTTQPITLRASDDETLRALQDAVGVLAAKWSVSVLARLAEGTHRFNELLRQIERDGLVERHVYARVPARVEYELSPVGEQLLVALVPLAGWGLEHQLDVTNAREHFDRLQRWRSEGEEIKARSQADARRIV
jgi:DNA-binding HxlR family transcriptional regulator